MSTLLGACQIDHNKGTAAGYIVKYILKNIDGYSLEEDINGSDAKGAAERVNSMG